MKKRESAAGRSEIPREILKETSQRFFVRLGEGRYCSVLGTRRRLVDVVKARKMKEGTKN